MRNVRVLLMIFMMCSLATAADQPCSLPAGLFQRKTSLTAELNAAINKGDKARQNDLQKKMKGVDEQYYRLMQTASESSEKGEVTACCSQNATDPIARLICRWAWYKTNKISSQQFVEQFPVASNDRQALWMLDRIANVRQAPDSLLSMFGPEGPVSSYIGALFTLAKGGDLPALKKYMRLYVAADGQYAELMEDQLEHLFLEHSDVVLHNWSFIKTNRRALQDLRESLSAEQKRQVISEAKKHCSANAEPCQDLSAALNGTSKADR